MTTTKIFKLMLAVIPALALFSCESEVIHYSGPTIVGFADSIGVISVEIDNAITEIELSVSNTSNEDRVFAVEPVTKKIVVIDDDTCKLAIEGFHYDLIESNVIIPAGQRVGSFKIKTRYENAKVREDVVAHFKIIAPKNQLSDVSSEISLILVKSIPFNIDDYVGYYEVNATFPFSDDFVMFFGKARKIDDYRIEFKGLIDTTNIVIIKFHPEDLLNPQVSVAKQIAFVDAVYRDVHCSTMLQAPSYFLASETLPRIFLNLRMEVIGLGTFGIFPYVLIRRSERYVSDATGKDDPIPFYGPEPATNKFSFSNFLK